MRLWADFYSLLQFFCILNFPKTIKTTVPYSQLRQMWPDRTTQALYVLKYTFAGCTLNSIYRQHTRLLCAIFRLTPVDVWVGLKWPTFFERLVSQSAWGEKFEQKSVFLAKCLEMGTRLIIYPYKVILTLFRPVIKPKPENVGLKGSTSHPSPVVRVSFYFWVLDLPRVMWLYCPIGQRGMSYSWTEGWPPCTGPTMSHCTLWPLH